MTSLSDLQNDVHRLLLRTGDTIAVAESCTGGLFGAAITNLAGSSAYFLGGALAYSDSVKVDLLAVDAALIQDHGAVSAPVALAMALGVIAATGARIGVSITGIAGPNGAPETKPVGTTYIGLGAPGIQWVHEFHWLGNRDENRASSVQAAYQIVLSYLNGSAPTVVSRAITEQPSVAC